MGDHHHHHRDIVLVEGEHPQLTPTCGRDVEPTNTQTKQREQAVKRGVRPQMVVGMSDEVSNHHI